MDPHLITSDEFVEERSIGCLSREDAQSAVLSPIMMIFPVSTIVINDFMDSHC
jgi:hypothetical protein